jgi:outer membrane receptor protein involved in Fe transport
VTGRLQIIAAATIAASVAAGSAWADEPDGLFARANPVAGSWTSLELGIAGLQTPAHKALSAAERNTSAGTTMKHSGWRASLFVNYFGPRQTIEDAIGPVKPFSFVNARLSGDVAKHTRLVFDVFNVFDRRVPNVDYLSATRIWNQPAALDNFLFNPVEPRGFRAKLRVEF